MRRFIFKINLNIYDKDDIENFLQNIDGYVCLSNLLPESKYGFCLGVVDFMIDDVPVALALYMVNETIDREWVRAGGIDLDIDKNNLRDQLYNKAKELVSAAI